MAIGFPIARYRFHFRVLDSLPLPVYAGSTLRGVFGHALRRIACMTGARECSRCPLNTTCPYTQLFETQSARHAIQHFSSIPPPYVIEPLPAANAVAAGDSYAFDMVLVGTAREQLPLIIASWQQAFAQGIRPGETGGRCGRAELEVVELLTEDGSVQRVYGAGGLVRTYDHQLSLAGEAPENVRIQLLTPLRINRKGEILGPRDLTATDLLLACARRAQLMSDFHAPGAICFDFQAIKAAAETIELKPLTLRWQKLSRWSNRQQQKTPLDGLVGTLQLSGDLRVVWPALILAEWLHIGKETVFGLGAVRLERESSVETACAK